MRTIAAFHFVPEIRIKLHQTLDIAYRPRIVFARVDVRDDRFILINQFAEPFHLLRIFSAALQRFALLFQSANAGFHDFA